MSLPDPTGRDDGSKKDGPIKTVEMGKITVFNYTLDSNIFAAICYLPIPPANIIPCVIALNTPCENRQFIRFNAVQSMIVSAGFFASTTVLSGLITVLAAIPFIGGLLSWILILANFLIIAVYIGLSLKLVSSAFVGKSWEVPFIGPLAHKYSNT